jgi:mRNA interferase MazF
VRGDIYFVDLRPRSGSEQRGRRPCIVVSTDAFNLAVGWQSITVVPLTTSPRWKEAHTVVRLRKGEANLPKGCAALAHQITTIDRSKLVVPKIGTLSRQRLDQLDEAILSYLAIEKEPAL